MTGEDPRRPLEFGGPASYRIVVRGRLEERAASRLGNMRLITGSPADRDLESTLVGRVQDQAELSGVLAALQGLNLRVLLVERLADESEG